MHRVEVKVKGQGEGPSNCEKSMKLRKHIRGRDINGLTFSVLTFSSSAVAISFAMVFDVFASTAVARLWRVPQPFPQIRFGNFLYTLSNTRAEVADNSEGIHDARSMPQHAVVEHTKTKTLPSRVRTKSNSSTRTICSKTQNNETGVPDAGRTVSGPANCREDGRGGINAPASQVRSSASRQAVKGEPRPVSALCTVSGLMSPKREVRQSAHIGYCVT